MGQQPYPEYLAAAAPAGYWVLDMQQPCWYGWHKTWALALGVPCVFVFCIGVPLVVLGILLTHRRDVSNARFVQRFGFLVRIYMPELYYWEFVIAVQTNALVRVSANGHTVGAFSEMMLLTFILGCSLVLHMLLKPHRHPQLYIMQLLA